MLNTSYNFNHCPIIWIKTRPGIKKIFSSNGKIRYIRNNIIAPRWAIHCFTLSTNLPGAQNNISSCFYSKKMWLNNTDEVMIYKSYFLFLIYGFCNFVTSIHNRNSLRISLRNGYNLYRNRKPRTMLSLALVRADCLNLFKAVTLLVARLRLFYFYPSVSSSKTRRHRHVGNRWQLHQTANVGCNKSRSEL